jgi:predicted TPR repeat methyltransferase
VAQARASLPPSTSAAGPACGEHLRPYSHHLSGVDLAGKMLEKAAATGLYDQLEKAEITDYLLRHPQSCDLVTAADTMIYFGDLEKVFKAVATVLRPGGHFVFTVEVLTPGCGGRWLLPACQRTLPPRARLRAHAAAGARAGSGVPE